MNPVRRCDNHSGYPVARPRRVLTAVRQLVGSTTHIASPPVPAEGMTSMDDVLRKAVLRRLSLLDEAAEQGEPGDLLPLARTEINRLADGWRLLLTVHQQDEHGRCAACPGWLRHRRWPCQVWVMAHRHLIGDGLPHRERRLPLRNPFSRWRHVTAGGTAGPGRADARHAAADQL